MTDNDGWTALHYYARYGDYEKIKYFDGKGIDMNLQTNDGKNCLHIAAFYGHLNLCERLIDEHKFSAHMTDNDGWTPLHFSTKYGSRELVSFFADMGIDILIKTNEGKNCLHVAANMGHFELCKELIDKYSFNVHDADSDGWTALHYSAEVGSYELITYFVDLGADIQLNTSDGKNCLHIAALHGHLNLCKALIDKHNFDANIADDNGCTALHYSVRKGSYELFSNIMHMVTNIYVQNKNGMNCLHLAALHGHLNICKTLIDDCQFNMHVIDNAGWTAFHYFAGNGSEKLVTYLLDLESATELKDKNGWNFLHIAALCGHLNLCKTLIDQKRFDVYVKDSGGCTALHFSARNGSYELVQFFTDRGVDIDLKDNDGCNCLHIGALYGHLNLCKTLIYKHNLDVGLA